MLTELSVRNVALIEEATLEFESGLNAITGETGAGKTLLATALQLLLGGRARSESVRAGSEKATVEGTFVLPDGLLDRILSEALGDLYDELDEEDLTEGLTLRRTLTGGGRSKCYVCGVSVPVKALAALGDRLVSYHGQREQGKLTDPAEQLRLLDDFLPQNARKALAEHAELWRDVGRNRRELADISAGSEARLREIDFLRYQVSEIQDSGYSSEEAAGLARERERLRNVTDLLEAVGAATGAPPARRGSHGGRR